MQNVYAMNQICKMNYAAKSPSFTFSQMIQKRKFARIKILSMKRGSSEREFNTTVNKVILKCLIKNIQAYYIYIYKCYAYCC